MIYLNHFLTKILVHYIRIYSSQQSPVQKYKNVIMKTQNNLLINIRGGVSFEVLEEFGIEIWYDIGESSFDGNIVKC